MAIRSNAGLKARLKPRGMCNRADTHLVILILVIVGCDKKLDVDSPKGIMEQPTREIAASSVLPPLKEIVRLKISIARKAHWVEVPPEMKNAYHTILASGHSFQPKSPPGAAVDTSTLTYVVQIERTTGERLFYGLNEDLRFFCTYPSIGDGFVATPESWFAIPASVAGLEAVAKSLKALADSE